MRLEVTLGKALATQVAQLVFLLLFLHVLGVVPVTVRLQGIGGEELFAAVHTPPVGIHRVGLLVLAYLHPGVERHRANGAGISLQTE